ncbi:MAG: hypothetical protein OXC62_01145 [Aestuariivita sp.]|nr:hypothetical protein [Aestuariivita sp.]
MSEHATQNKQDDLSKSTVNDSEIPIKKKEEVLDKDVMSKPKLQSSGMAKGMMKLTGGFTNFAIIIFGGILAGFVGFAVSISDDIFSTSNEEELYRLNALEVELSNKLAELEQTVTGITSRQEEFFASVDLLGISAQIEANFEQLKAVQTFSDRLHILELRVEDISNNVEISTLSTETIASIDSDLADLRASLTQQQQDLELMFSEASQREEMASNQLRKANAQVSVTRLIAALDAGGQDISDYIIELEALGIAVVKEITKEAKGIVTLQALQIDYPSLARETLKAARQSSESDRFLDFLKRQVNMRSVTPREGNSLDAILSRAESKLKSGELASALAELQTLPEMAKVKFSTWIEKAQKRVSAIAAANALLDKLTAQ